MTYQDKVAVIDNGRASLENGASWDDFQAQLVSLPDFYQKDIDATGVKVMTSRVCTRAYKPSLLTAKLPRFATN